MTHTIYKGELANKLITYDPLLLMIPDRYCIVYSTLNGYKTVMNYHNYLSIWGKDLETVEPVDLPEEILFKFLALYETLNDFYEAFELTFN